jgi:urease accessory protein
MLHTIGTILLHAIGLGLGLAIGRAGERQGVAAVRMTGAATTLVGIGILTGLI